MICGLTVKIDVECGLNVTVSPGLALDGCGDPLQLPAPVTIAFDKRKADQLGIAGTQLLGRRFAARRNCASRALWSATPTIMTAPPRRPGSARLSEVSILFEEPEMRLRLPHAGRTSGRGAGQRGAAGAAAQPAPGATPATTRMRRASIAPRIAAAAPPAIAAAAYCSPRRRSPEHGRQWSWTVQHKGIRRLVRAALVADREPGAPPPAVAEAVQPPPAASAPDKPAPADATDKPAADASAAAAPVAEAATAPPADGDRSARRREDRLSRESPLRRGRGAAPAARLPGARRGRAGSGSARRSCRGSNGRGA